MRAVLVSICLVAFAACGTTGSAKRSESLIDASKRYEEGLRWGRFEDAAASRLPHDREAFLDERDELAENLRIDDYEVLRVHIAKDEERARLTVKYTWHKDDEGVVRETVVDERWVWKRGDWYLERATHKRGDKMPGIPDARPEDKEGDGDKDDDLDGRPDDRGGVNDEPVNEQAGEPGSQAPRRAAASAGG